MVAVLGGGGGAAGVVTAYVAYRRYKVEGSLVPLQIDDQRFQQMETLVKSYKDIVDEYRQEAGSDQRRMAMFENTITALREEHVKCQEDLREESRRRNDLQKRVHRLEEQVAELDG